MGTNHEKDSILARLGGRGVVGQIRQQLDELAAARDQLELLLQVVTDISSELDLQATLHRIVGAAIRLTGARYGALGVRARDGTLAAFLHEGMKPETAALIGYLPAGKGLLGLLLNRTEARRRRIPSSRSGLRPAPGQIQRPPGSQRDVRQC